MNAQAQAIAAFADMQKLGTIVIGPEHWATGPGIRRARIVGCTRATVIRWYVGGKLFHQMPVTPENVNISKRWAS